MKKTTQFAQVDGKADLTTSMAMAITRMSTDAIRTLLEEYMWTISKTCFHDTQYGEDHLRSIALVREQLEVWKMIEPLMVDPEVDKAYEAVREATVKLFVKVLCNEEYAYMGAVTETIPALHKARDRKMIALCKLIKTRGNAGSAS
ncbi:hypothetical protein [Paraburkholderia humisilvae]|uniref:Uncharacterized protein n=1 Tax=Paraburkholderia humisilvae TaxID=627669 RepID=A0A6J5DZG0_9BURK|nr:hypothetical protein [Paraburkholderia humisilvae]CAB3758651.1 hypothetical protein LMG29542_03396 [Paraburkholderia humisilvae]